MQLNIVPSLGTPIYKQIYEQVERMIINEQLSAGTLLPSVRQIALELEVNPMTVSKAYGLLEERGFVERKRGKGMMVAQLTTKNSQQEKLKILANKVELVIQEAEQMGISNQQLSEIFTQQLQCNATKINHEKE